MHLPRRGRDRPPRVVAGPSTLPAANGLRSAMNPTGSKPYAGDVGRDADNEPSLSDRYDLAESESFGDRHPPRVDAWQSSAGACADGHSSRFLLSWRRYDTHAKRFSYRSADRCNDPDCPGRARPGVFGVSGASVREVLQAI